MILYYDDTIPWAAASFFCCIINIILPRYLGPEHTERDFSKNHDFSIFRKMKNHDFSKRDHTGKS